MSLGLSPLATRPLALGPEVASGSNTPVNPGVGSLALTGYAPVIARTAHQAVAPGVGSLAITGYAPNIAQTVGSGVTVSPAAGQLTVTGYAPTIARTSHQFVAPPRGLLTITGYAPSIVQAVGSQTVTPGRGTLTITGYAPTLYQGPPAVYPIGDYAATIMRESIINKETTALIDRIAAQAGTMSDKINRATVMRADAENVAGTMRDNETNMIAELL